MRFLTTTEYDALLLRGLALRGADESAIRTLLEARWPLFGAGLVAEASGRGVEIALPDVQAYLDHLLADSGEPPADAATALFGPASFDNLLRWCIKSQRAKATRIGQMMQERPRDLRAILAPTKAGEN